ncbi:DinB family protein [Occallatibacter riparius]|uniref:DinB family protein n=1 Tax=Occallatibacter riparius TaxID=1002689 RepID=A0A9J7BYX4_9BACT|nr:DinB family protein [Occallatibacter riparius]UWZ86670.1 DinB family protein [Occallatibacter riparius]
MKCKFSALVLGLIALPAALLAQQAAPAPSAAPANPITASERGLYMYLSGAVVRAAEKMPEENYSFKASPDVRSFGQLIGHEADANNMFCALATGEPNPAKNIEKTKTSKADLVAAVKDAVAYCGKAFDGMTDAKGAEIIKIFGSMNIARLTVFSLNTAHTDEHYGNIVTYMRLKGIVPPTSESQPAPASAPK